MPNTERLAPTVRQSESELNRRFVTFAQKKIELNTEYSQTSNWNRRDANQRK